MSTHGAIVSAPTSPHRHRSHVANVCLLHGGDSPWYEQ